MNLQEGKGVRKLQHEGSHAESPARKEAKVEEKVPSDDEEGELDDDMGRKRRGRKEEGRKEEDKLDSMNNMMTRMMIMVTDMEKELKKDVSDETYMVLSAFSTRGLVPLTGHIVLLETFQ